MRFALLPAGRFRRRLFATKWLTRVVRSLKVPLEVDLRGCAPERAHGVSYVLERETARDRTKMNACVAGAMKAFAFAETCLHEERAN
jgi:hypothetical protein